MLQNWEQAPKCGRNEEEKKTQCYIPEDRTQCSGLLLNTVRSTPK
jgi:hypothetical protein